VNVPTYLINLDSDKERLASMEKQLLACGIHYERFPAIRGDQLPEWLYPFFFNQDGSKSSQLSQGEIGCYASHLALMSRVVNSNAPALILEDDLIILPDFPKIISMILESELSWDIFRLTSKDKSPTIKFSSLTDGYEVVKYIRVPPKTGAHLVTPEGARKFLEWQKPRWRPVDQDLRRVWELDLLTLGISPLPATQDVMPSTIDQIGLRIKAKKKKYMRDNKWRDRLHRFIYNIGSIGFTKTLLGMAGIASNK
jgi:glycosyl transferase family 25